MYRSDFDSQLRFCTRANKTPTETIEYGAIHESFAEIDALVAKDAAAASTVQLPPILSSTGVGGTSAGGDNASTEAVTASLADPSDWAAMNAWFHEHALRCVLETIKLISDQPSERALAAIVAATSLGSTHGDMTGHAIIHFDVNLSGESMTSPHIRTSPFRKDQAIRLYNAMMIARRNPADAGICKIAKGDIYVYVDGGKKGAAMTWLAHVTLCTGLMWPMLSVFNSAATVQRSVPL